jgi:hypothetical protein
MLPRCYAMPPSLRFASCFSMLSAAFAAPPLMPFYFLARYARFRRRRRQIDTLLFRHFSRLIRHFRYFRR